MNSTAKYYLHKVYLWIVMGVAATMTFNIENVNVNGIFIALLALISIIHLIVSKQKPTVPSAPIFISLIVFYLIHVIGVVYSQNQKEAMFVLEKKLGLILLPVLFLFGPRLNSKEIKAVLLSFVGSCVFVCVFCLGISLAKFVETKDITFFYYHSLSINAGMHATYLAMYLCFAIAILLYLLIKRTLELSKFQKTMYFFSIILMSLIIFALSARTHIAILMVEVIVYFIFKFKLNKSPLRAILFSAIIICVILGIALLFPRTRERFKEGINYNNEYSANIKWGEKQMRALIWRSAWQASKNNLLIGTGTGDVQDDLHQIYLDREYISLTYLPKTRFNAHDQYLETLVGLGVIGLLGFLAVIVLSVRNALRTRNDIFLICTLLFAVSCITESMLERQNGLIFFSFFSVFLLTNNYAISKAED